jgi:hypothetical protein
MVGDKEIQPDPGQWEKWVGKKDNTVFCHRREIELRATVLFFITEGKMKL